MRSVVAVAKAAPRAGLSRCGRASLRRTRQNRLDHDRIEALAHRAAPDRRASRVLSTAWLGEIFNFFAGRRVLSASTARNRKRQVCCGLPGREKAKDSGRSLRALRSRSVVRVAKARIKCEASAESRGTLAGEKQFCAIENAGFEPRPKCRGQKDRFWCGGR